MYFTEIACLPVSDIRPATVHIQYNKTIIEFGFCKISKPTLTLPSVICHRFASTENSDLGLNNSKYHAQPHPIIGYIITIHIC